MLLTRLIGDVGCPYLSELDTPLSAGKRQDPSAALGTAEDVGLVGSTEFGGCRVVVPQGKRGVGTQ